MAENEEDYLDGLLKSLSEDENAQSENKDEEEEQIKEQVREAFEKSNEKSTKFENIYDDEDGNLNDDNIEDLLKDVMTVPRRKLLRRHRKQISRQKQMIHLRISRQMKLLIRC